MSYMRVLTIATSGPTLRLALSGLDGEIRACLNRRARADFLSSGLKQILVHAGWKLHTLRRIIVDIGPGSFTGIRVGVSFARALAQGMMWYGKKLEVVGIPSLMGLAAAARDGRSEGSKMMVLRHARQNEFYSGVFKFNKGHLEGIGHISVLSKEQVKVHIRDYQCDVVVGDEESLSISEWKWHFPSIRPVRLLPELMVSLANSGGNKTYKNLLPLYARKTFAEEKR